MVDSANRPHRVFISYSHKDEAWKERLHTQLKVLERQNQLSIWEDRQIAAGADWYPAIETAINSADVAILLISADFLGSKFINGEEVPRLLARRKKEGLLVIPLILSPCAWQAIPWLASIQGKPKDNKPLSGLLPKFKQDQCLADSALEILALVGQQVETGDHDSEFTEEELQDQLREYKRYLVESYKYLDFKGIDSIAEAVKGSSGITLESVYVPLRARLDAPDTETWHQLGGRLYRGSTAVADAAPDKLEQEISRTEQDAMTVEAWFNRQPALVILGDPGSGKSTTMKRLALGLAQQDNAALPILVSLNAYGKRLEEGIISFEEFLPEYFHGKRAQLDRHKLRKLFTDALKQKKAVVLMDGLDEVGLNRGPLVGQIEHFVRAWIPERPLLKLPKRPQNPDQSNERIISAKERKKIRDVYRCEVEQFHYESVKIKNEYESNLLEWQKSGNRMVATSRFVGYHDYPLSDPRWQTVALNDWNREEIDRFFTGFTLACELAWKGGENREEAQRLANLERLSLLRVIDANPGIRRLAGNPLLASLLALIKRQGVTLPERRVELYKLYMETMLRSWNRARSLDKQPIGPEIDFSPTQRLLAKLALHLRQTNPQGGLIHEEAMNDYLLNYFRDDDFSRMEAEGKAKGFLDSVHKYSNLLIEKGHRQYGFIHLTFEEYLAGFGLALERDEELQKLFPDYLQQPELWQETLLLSLGVMAVINNDRDKANAVLDGLLKSAKPDAVLFALSTLKDVGTEGLGNRMVLKIQKSLLALGQDESQPLSKRRWYGLILGDSGLLADDLDLLIHITKGPFLCGDSKTQTEITNDYWIGKYPVTNAQYKRFIEAGGYQNQAYWTEQACQQRNKNLWQQPKYWEHSGWANPLSPVVGVSFYEAQAYCIWFQALLLENPVQFGLAKNIPKNYACRLPTHLEWERAARGVDGREFPWGNEFKAGYANCADSWEQDAKDRGTTAVGLFVQGVSPDGLLDCSGNVWEWTSSGNENYYIRGGSWYNRTGFLRCAVCYGDLPYGQSNYIGFRLVFGPPL